MKLIKLVYIAHAWSLVFRKRPLIAETIQAWKYGPVIESLYHAFKCYGNSPIPITSTDSMPQDEIDSSATDLLDKVWKKYGGLSGTHLSALTHQANTPWDQTWNKNGGSLNRYTEIPNELILSFYRNKLEHPESGSGH